VIQDDEPVIKVTPVNDSSVIVKTSKAEYEARNVVIAAGPWTSQLTEPLGLQLPLEVQRFMPATTVCGNNTTAYYSKASRNVVNDKSNNSAL
jgi:glycine/D-amino acid oxidase-like deaminating enzyme